MPKIKTERRLVRVQIVEDDPDVGRGIRAVLERDGRFAVIGEGPLLAIDDRVKANAPDVVLVGLRNWDSSGPEAVRRLRAALPHARIVVHPASADAEALREGIACGAAADVLKGLDLRPLLDALAA